MQLTFFSLPGVSGRIDLKTYPDEQTSKQSKSRYNIVPTFTTNYHSPSLSKASMFLATHTPLLFLIHHLLLFLLVMMPYY